MYRQYLKLCISNYIHLLAPFALLSVSSYQGKQPQPSVQHISSVLRRSSQLVLKFYQHYPALASWLYSEHVMQ